MNIKKIKILGGDGLKGLEITYSKQEDKDGRSFNTDVKEEKRYPIHLALETKFKELREFIAEICGLTSGSLDKKEVQYILNEVEVTGLKITNDSFLLSGKFNTFADKKIAINTPLIDEADEYINFDKAQKVIDELLIEVKAYYDGTKKATDVEIAYKIIQQQSKKGKETISESDFDAMSPDEQKAFCTAFLEKNGSMVTHIEDLDLPEGDAQIMELKKAI